ncbi:cell division protein ZipA C-terminal FtsZ-binding domain-containing protein [Variovorax sp. J22R133]|uniref:cell division protein ZipA C-terminal FtsZ-binding domain-containing protein n=1 Tax=Variovorax brevis TaxID=3053503 RepID=UPI002578CD18|nr:cell division protein ZipA C-terminal FtsZ-binding domain-containing protein [Variovorax sp. J22R133]MDM0111092.1 cell division protein ZipA C-terminal FtsZ-binding domain-containing protein [Variovorax sp. J22R133]
MSSLTVALAILGGLVLAAYVGYNAWMFRRNTPRQPQMQEANEGPAPVATERTNEEPVLHIEPHSPPGNERHEPLFDPDLPAPSALAAISVERRGGLDPLIDVIAPIALDNLVSGDAALAAMPATRRAGSKPVAIEGLNERTGQWEQPLQGQRYRGFQAGVQLANRTGALNEIEYSEFVVKAQAFADAINGTPEFPEMLDEVARARELDQFASSHDAQLSFVLRAQHAAWSPGYVQQTAARLGFVAGMMPGRMVLPTGEAGMPPVLGLSFDTQAALADDPTQSAIRELTLSLDVPQVERAERPFERMRDAASGLARDMDGVVTDGDGQLLREATMDIIGADLEQLYDTLDTRDLAAGSALARRLFS